MNNCYFDLILDGAKDSRDFSKDGLCMMVVKVDELPRLEVPIETVVVGDKDHYLPSKSRWTSMDLTVISIFDEGFAQEVASCNFRPRNLILQNQDSNSISFYVPNARIQRSTTTNFCLTQLSLVSDNWHFQESKPSPEYFMARKNLWSLPLERSYE